jgi:hypothetical protein
MNVRYKVGEVITYKGGPHVITDVMDNEHANWLYGVAPVGKEDMKYWKEHKTVFKHELEDVYKENEQKQLTIFDMEGGKS